MISLLNLTTGVPFSILLCSWGIFFLRLSSGGFTIDEKWLKLLKRSSRRKAFKSFNGGIFQHFIRSFYELVFYLFLFIHSCVCVCVCVCVCECV